MLEKPIREDEEKLELLRRLAKEGFDQLDRGEGMEFEDDEMLEECIAQLGRKAGDSISMRHR